MEVQFLERCHPPQVLDAARGVVRAAKRGHVQVERHHTLERSDGRQGLVRECAGGADREKRVVCSGLGQSREVVQQRCACVGEPGANEHTRQRLLARERGNCSIAGVGPLEVDALEVLVGAQPLDSAIGDLAAA